MTDSTVSTGTIRAHLDEAERTLDGQSAARLDAEVLLAYALHSPRAQLYAHPERVLSTEQSAAFKQLINRRAQGVPVAYLVGEREFWSLPLKVTSAVLIPRPETERLVELVLEKIPPGSPWRVADLGTGSGAIAVALATERPECEIHAVDCDANALAVATENAARLQLRNISLHLGSWCTPLQGHFEVLVTNPPYVESSDAHLQQGDCRFEPRIALSPGPDGLSAFREVIREAKQHLAPGGWLFLEHGPQQGAAVAGLLRESAYMRVKTESDLLGHERVTRAQAPPAE